MYKAIHEHLPYRVVPVDIERETDNFVYTLSRFGKEPKIGMHHKYYESERDAYLFLAGQAYSVCFNLRKLADEYIEESRALDEIAKKIAP